MASKRVTSEEQFRLVTECRRSGLSDAQWCLQNGISISTFYTWTSRLRKKGCSLPDPVSGKPVNGSDIVRLDLPSISVSAEAQMRTGSPWHPLPSGIEAKCPHPCMELSYGSAVLKISGTADADFLAALMLRLGEGTC